MAFITAQADGRLDFDALIASIGRFHPGTAVTVPDYYAARLASATATARAEGWPVPNPSLTCLAKLSEEHGVQRKITIPIRDGLTLTGRVDRLGVLFTAERFSRAEVAPLVELLAAAGLSVEIGGAG